MVERDLTVANLNNRSVSFSMVPSGNVFAPDQPQTFDPDQSIVILSDQFPGMILSLSGQAVSLEEGASVMGAVFQTGSGLMGDAMATLQSGESTEAPTLDRIVMQVATIDPGRDLPVTAERVLLDRAAVAEAVEDGLPFETSDPVRSGMLAASMGSFLLYSGTSPLATSERASMQLSGLANLLDFLVSETTGIAEEGSSVISAMLSNKLAEIFVEDTERDIFHAAPSVALIRTITAPSSSVGAVARSIKSDLIIDGRFTPVASAALGWAVNAAGIETQTIT